MPEPTLDYLSDFEAKWRPSEAPPGEDPTVQRQPFTPWQNGTSQPERSFFGNSVLGTAGDIGLAPLRGAANAAIDAYDLGADLADHVGIHFLPQVEKFKSQTGAGQLVSDLFQIGAGFAAGGAILKGVGVAAKLAEAGALGRFAFGVGKGAIANSIFYNADSNFSNLLEGWGAKNTLLDALAIGPDDTQVTKRLKSAIEGAGLGAFTDVAFAGISGLVKNARINRAVEEGVALAKEAADGPAKKLRVSDFENLGDIIRGGEGKVAAAKKLSVSDFENLGDIISGKKAPPTPEINPPPNTLTTKDFEQLGQAIKDHMLQAHELAAQRSSGLIPKSSPLHPDNADRLVREAAAAGKLAGIEDRGIAEANLFGFTPGTGESATIEAAVGKAEKELQTTASGSVKIIGKPGHLYRTIESASDLFNPDTVKLNADGVPKGKITWNPQGKAAYRTLAEAQAGEGYIIEFPSGEGTKVGAKYRPKSAQYAEAGENAGQPTRIFYDSADKPKDLAQMKRAFPNTEFTGTDFGQHVDGMGLFGTGPDLKAKLKQAWQSFTDDMGMGPGKQQTFMERLNAQIPDDTQQAMKLTARLQAYNQIKRNLSEKIRTALEPIKDFNKLPAPQMAELVDMIETAGNYTRSMQGLASYYGKGLRTFRQDSLSLEPLGIGKGVLKNESETMFGGIPIGDLNVKYDPEKAMQYLNAKGGMNKIAKILQFHQDNFLTNGEGALANTTVHGIGKAWDVVAEYYVNSLLSHGQTHVVNFIGNVMTTLYRPLETLVGGALRLPINPSGGIIAMKDGIRNIAELNMTFLDTMGLLKPFGGADRGGASIRNAIMESFKTGKSTLLSGMKDAEKYALFGHSISADNFTQVGNNTFPMLTTMLGMQPEALRAVEGGAINAAGAVIRTPSKFLTAADELFKQINFRARARTILMEEADHIGIPLEQRASFIAEKMDRIVSGGQAYNTHTIQGDYQKYLNENLDNGQRTDPKAIETATNQFFWSGGADPGALKVSEAAVDRAREVTFTEESGRLIGLIDSAKRYFPPLRLVMPFVSTPVNLVKFAARRTLDPAFGTLEAASSLLSGRNEGFMNSLMNKLRAARGLPSMPIQEGLTKFAKDLASSDPIRKADAMGRAAFGTGLVTLAWGWAVNADDPNATVSITGKGPSEPNARKLWGKDNIPYAIQIGKPDDPNRVQFEYRRVDPLALILGPVADYVTYSHFASKAEQSHLDAGWGALLAGVSNIVDKTWLSGLQDTIDLINSKDPYKIAQVGRSFVGNFTRPGVVASPAWAGPDGDYLREVHSIADAKLNRTPWGRGELMPQRNVLGEAVERKKQVGEETAGRWMSFFSPIREQVGGKDPVIGEMSRLNYGFAPTEDSFTLGGVNVPLDDFKSASGQTAADRYAELVGTSKAHNGQTLRQTLAKFIASPEYKKLPEYQGEDALQNQKVRAIGGVISAYRGLAQAQLVKEYKDIQTFVKSKLAVAVAGVKH